MKKLIFIGAVFTILSITWILYLKHSERSFINDIYQQSPATNQPVQDSTQPFTNVEVPQEEALTIQKSSTLTDKIPTNTEHTDSMNRQDADASSSIDLLTMEKNLLKSLSKYDSFDTYTEIRPSLSYEEMIEARRKDFIRRFGDIPAVHILLKHLPLITDRGQDSSQTVQTVIILDGNDLNDLNDKFLNDEFAKAVLTLWPTPENQEAFKRMMQMREELLKELLKSEDGH